jgi:CBS domain-containing protein
MSSFLDLFDATIGTITRDKKDLVEIKSSASIKHALRLMADHNVSFLPLYEAPQSDSDVSKVSQGKSYVGLVSICDVIEYILRGDAEAESVPYSLEAPIVEVVGESAESAIDLSLTIENESTPLSSVLDKMSQGFNPQCFL